MRWPTIFRTAAFAHSILFASFMLPDVSIRKAKETGALLSLSKVSSWTGTPWTRTVTFWPITLTCCKNKSRDSSSAIFVPIACNASPSLAQLPRPVGIVVL